MAGDLLEEPEGGRRVAVIERQERLGDEQVAALDDVEPSASRDPRRASMPGAGLRELAMLAEAHDDVEGIARGAGRLAAIDRGVVGARPGPGRARRCGRPGTGAQREPFEVVDVEVAPRRRPRTGRA